MRLFAQVGRDVLMSAILFVMLFIAAVFAQDAEPTADASTTIVSVASEVKDAVDRVVAAVNAFKDATSKSIDAANAVKTAVQSKNFSAIKDAKKKVEIATEAVKTAKADVGKAIEAMNSAGPEAAAAVKAMGIDLAMFAGKDGGDETRDRVKKYTVSVKANLTKRGHVSRNPSQPNYTSGTIVTVTATPDNGYRFTGWSGDVIDKTNPLNITVDGNKKLIADFYPPCTVNVNAANPTNGGHVSRSPDLTNYTQGTTVIVTATPNNGYVFKCWSGTVTSTANPLEITLNGNTTLTATFDIKNSTKIDNTVKIGNQTWMAENLNYPTLSGSWCYGNDNSNCEKYGRLYDWYTAKTVACPTGWRLPSNQEWNTLVSTVNATSAAKNLKSATQWKYGGNGANVYGFSALPGGVRYTRGGFNEVGSSGYWWTSTEVGSGTAYRRRIDYDKDQVGELAVYSESKEDFGKRFGFSVRCLQDN